MIKVIDMAKPKITLYDLSDKEYHEVIDTINSVAGDNKRTAWIVVDEIGEVTGNPPIYSKLTLSIKTREGSYSQLEKGTAINIIKGLTSLFNFD